MSLIEMTEEVAAAEKASAVSAVHLKLGALSGVVKEALLSAYEMAAAGTLAEGSRLVIEDVPVLIYCPECDDRTQAPELYELWCPVCRSPESRVVQGKELLVTGVEIERAERGGGDALD